MENGWIKLHRKILDNPISKKPNYLALWVVLLLKANHKEKQMIWNNNIIIIKEGQLLTGRKELARETGIPEGTIEGILTAMEQNQHLIEQQKTTKYRVITILNWKDYQASDNKTDNKPTTNRQQTDTNKNDNNDKKRETIKFLDEISDETIKQMTTKFRCDEAEVRTKAKTLANYCRYKGKRYKDYRAFLGNALRKDYGERPPQVEVEVVNGVAFIKK